MSDTDEEPGDFSTLLRRSQRGKAPRRGTKAFPSKEQQEEALETSRDALFELIGETKRVHPKSTSQGVLNRETGETTIVKSKGAHLHAMGHTVKGQTVLFPEEAAWLLNMHNLIVTDPEGMSCHFEDYCTLMFTSADGWINFEKYQTYAYLRRLGYFVLRHRPPAPVSRPHTHPSLLVTWCSWLWGILNRMVRSIFRYFVGFRSLVHHGVFNTNEDVYKRLRIIDAQPWESKETVESAAEFHWDVYRPHPKWKKKDPGTPDFCVAVTSPREALPTLADYQALFQSTWQHAGARHLSRYRRRGEQAPAFLMAVVGDAEGVSFLKITGDGAADLTH
ncbi:hypothetical protein BCR43DRAFT_515487 [Syncephalastrum racemosum]|uniref:tRNA-splicing endonuclease subunit Sen54 N-terminal domain-containing protein n=1 Tax=Syncephalastrum racemosum TaxID=13706 RepID=A0A1X2H9N0_SYNRA|nr:hypothetical protein BCR43DRAFT_515487 [Syncephalastrum racemosum]